MTTTMMKIQSGVNLLPVCNLVRKSSFTDSRWGCIDNEAHVSISCNTLGDLYERTIG